MRIEVIQDGAAERDEEHSGELLNGERGNRIHRRVRAGHAEERRGGMHRRIKRTRIHREPVTQNRGRNFHDFFKWSPKFHATQPNSRRLNQYKKHFHQPTCMARIRTTKCQSAAARVLSRRK